MATLIRGGTVVTADQSYRADVLCDHGLIKEIAPFLRALEPKLHRSLLRNRTRDASRVLDILFDAQDPLIRENHNAVFDAVTVLTPSMILDTRVALTRYIEAAERRHVPPG